MKTISKTKQAILDHIIPKERHGDVMVKLGERGGYNIYSKKGDPLDRYSHSITEDQRAMGKRIASWARISQIYAPSGFQLDPVTGSGKREMTEAQVIAWENYFMLMREIQRVHGQRWVHAVRDICVMGETLESRKELKYRERKIKPLGEVLQTAFDYWKKNLHHARQSDKVLP